MQVLANRLDRGVSKYRQEYEDAAIKCIRSGTYILGEELENFESEWSIYNRILDNDVANDSDSKREIYCAGVASGLDALQIALHCMEIKNDDEVIVQGNTFIASIIAITRNGAKPVFVEPDSSYQIDIDEIEKLITDKTRAVMVVHLYGHVCNMTKVVEICKKHRLKLIEDCAQAHGAMWNGQKVGTFGDAGCFSFYPTKNLGAFGDAGAIITSDKKLIDNIRMYRNYGSSKKYYNDTVGMNSRLDELQAAMLRIGLRHLGDNISERRKIAAIYDKKINNDRIKKPIQEQGGYAVYHQYVVRCKERDKLMNYLSERGVGSIIHYPIPPHLQKAYEYLGYGKGMLPITESYAEEVLSLPMYIGMTDEEQKYVIETVNAF